jgi:hypothetical protein
MFIYSHTQKFVVLWTAFSSANVRSRTARNTAVEHEGPVVENVVLTTVFLNSEGS